MPDIIGSFQADQNHIGYICNNAFSRTTGTGYTHNDNMTSNATSYIEFHASDSNAIYGGDSLTILAAGLPNIVGDIGGFIYSLNGKGAMDGAHGAFASGGNLTQFAHSNGDNNDWYDFKASFNASRSSSIYGNSDTVQPPAIVLIPQVKY